MIFLRGPLRNILAGSNKAVLNNRYSKPYFLSALHRAAANMSRTGAMDTTKVAEELEKYLNMPLEKKRLLYKDKTHVTLDNVPTWEQYFQENKDRLQKQLASSKRTEVKSYLVNSAFNNKVCMWRGSITHLEIDAIVNAANSRLLGGGGVDGAIHAAAGPKLLDECRTLNGCETGSAKMTGGYNLPAKFVIHTVGPQGQKKDLLESCYKTSLRLLLKKQLRTIAFPCISTGIYGYPQEPAAHVALGTIRNFLEENPNAINRVIFCLFLPADVTIYENLMQLYFPV